MSDHDQKDDWAPNQCTPFSCQVRLDINSTRECAIAAIKATVTEATHKGSGACGHAPFLRTLDALVDQAGGCVLTNESRLVPILLFQRKNNSKPVTLIQINPHAAECTIYLYPNLAGPGNTNAAKLSIIFENSFPAAVEFSENIRSLIWYVEDGIPLGLHAHESLLRASTFETHLPESEEQTQSIISALGEKIETLRRIRRLFEFCIKVFRWDIFFNGHDCYESGILTNIALQGGVSCANLHKGEAGAVFRDTPPVEFCSQNGLMFSRVRTYIELRAFKAESPAPEGAALNAQREIFNRRLTDLNTLPYMKVNQDSVRGFSFFKDLTGAESLEEYSSNVVGAVTWLFCFHSFSDQAHYYGLDGFESHFQFFLLAAKTIAKFYPQDLIVTRPHPNTLGYIYDARYNGTQGTAYMDVLLQAELTKRIRSFHLATVVSGPSTVPQQLFRDPNQIVVTRWGSIAPEAAALGIPSIFSALAPYASLFPEIYHASAVEALESRIHEIRKMISIGSPLQLPCLDAIALYRYRLSTREDGSELSPALACTDHFIEASQCELPLTGESLSASRNLHISRFHQLSAARTDRERALLKILLGLI